MGRHKQDNSRTKALTFKFTQKEYDLIKLLSAEDKAELIDKVRILVNAYTANKVSKYNSSKPENNSSKLVNDNSSKPENNSSKLINDNSSKLVNDEVKPHELNNSSNPELTDEEINDLIEDVKMPVHKAIKHRKQKSKELSDFEIEQLLIEQQSQATYNGVNSLFEGGCE